MTAYIARRVLILSCIVFATILPAGAASKDMTLTQDKVTRFLASFPEMRIIAVSQGLKIGGEIQSSNNFLLGVMKAIGSTKLQTEARNVAEKHGFGTLKEWTQTGRAIGQAYLHVTAGPKGGISSAKIEKHKETAAREIEKLGFLTQKQKDKLKDNLDAASGELAHVPPPENLAIVKEMRSAIETAVHGPVQ